MKVEYTRLLIILICLIVHMTNGDEPAKRDECQDFSGDISNCQRFIRCFHNLRVLFTCASATAYVPELQTCVAKDLVINCDDSKNRVEVTISTNETIDTNDEYPTIEADLNALEVPMQKSLSPYMDVSVTPRQFGCSSYCYNQGVCILVGQAITCRCRPGFVGARCQIEQSFLSARQDCASNPCLNGATCVPTFPNTFTCVCAAGFTGVLCDATDGSSTNITTTTVPTNTNNTGQLCPQNPCLNGASCFTTPGGGFRCACTSGFTGLLCDVTDGPIPPTSCGTTNPCANAGTCVSTSSGFQCQCVSGFSGSNCQVNTALSIRNQCQGNPCQNGGSCYLTQNGFACACRTGYSGQCCDVVLAATNPCFNNPCQNSGTCQVVAANTYRCICPVGLLGVRCEQRICDPNPCLYGGVCLPYGNSFQCQCPPQYTGRCCELLVVTTAAPNPCNPQPCQNGGTCRATSAIAFVCSCTPSYYGRCCEIRNYCQPNPCYNGGTCIATTNGYICQCTYPTSGSNCELTLSTRAPQPTCACVLCPCPTAAPASSNPCLPNPCQNNGGCAVVQSNPQCYCQPAFTGLYCEYTRKRTLINSLCANVTCLNGGQCFATDNGAQCACRKPYFGERCELMNRPRGCSPNPCYNDGQCILTKDGHKCVCKNGTSGILCEQKLMPKGYRWCPLECQSGTSCVYEGSTPKCRVLNIYE